MPIRVKESEARMKNVGRKLYHLIGGLVLMSVYYLAGRSNAFAIYAVLFVVMLAFDIVRLKFPEVNRLVFRYFGSFIRNSEEKKLTGTPFYILGVALSFALFDSHVAATAVGFLAFGDVAASAIGEQYGKTKIRDKSVEGTVAFVIAAIGAGLLFHIIGIGSKPGVAISGAVVAAGVELLPVQVNDNLAIPLIAGAVMQYL
jgi:dolichol kinase